MKNFKKGFAIPLIIAIIAVLIIGGGVYLYKDQKPDLIIQNVSFLPYGMTVTIKNIGKKDAVGKIYLCTADMGDEKHKQQTVSDFTCDHVSLIKTDPRGTPLESVSIKAGESLDVWEQRSDSYVYPLYIAVDKTLDPALDNLIKESDETNNLYIIKSAKDATASRAKSNTQLSSSTLEHIQYLVKCASDLSNMEKSRHCRDSLSEINVNAQFEQIFSLLTQIKSGNVSSSREPILFAISHAKSPAVVPSLIRHIDDSEKDISKAAIEGLGHIASAEAIEAVMDVIRNGSSEKADIAKVVIQNAALEDKDGAIITTLSNYVFDGNDIIANVALHGIVISSNSEFATKTLRSLSIAAKTQSQKSMIQKAISDRQKIHQDMQ
jgi:hypothetical protein